MASRFPPTAGNRAVPCKANAVIYFRTRDKETRTTTNRTRTATALAALAALGLAAAMPACAQQALYVADPGNNSIERFTPGGVASVFAASGLDGPASLAFGPAPEPSQWAALGIGVLGVGGLALKARKRRRAA